MGAKGATRAIAVIAFVLAGVFVGHPFKVAGFVLKGANLIAQTPPPRTPGQASWSSDAPCECHRRARLDDQPARCDERKQIVDYLISVFKPGGRIYINLAGAKDLAKLLDFPLDEAERISAQRREKGMFASVDEVKNIPGVTAAKIDARASELEF